MLNRYFIAGSIFAMMWDYLAEPQTTRFATKYPDTDFDIYIKAKDDIEWCKYAQPVLDAYKAETDQNDTNYTSISHRIDTKEWLCVNSVNLIEIRKGNPQEVIRTFDMEHCKIYYDVGADTLTISPAQLYLVKNKKMIFEESKARNPEERKQKYLSRGWTIHQELKVDDGLPMNDDIPF